MKSSPKFTTTESHVYKYSIRMIHTAFHAAVGSHDSNRVDTVYVEKNAKNMNTFGIPCLNQLKRNIHGRPDPTQS